MDSHNNGNVTQQGEVHCFGGSLIAKTPLDHSKSVKEADLKSRHIWEVRIAVPTVALCHGD